MTKLSSQNPARLPNQGPRTAQTTPGQVSQSQTQLVSSTADRAEHLDQVENEAAATYEAGSMGREFQPSSTGISAKGQQVLQDFTGRVELASEMSARDLFDPSVERIDGPGLHKEISSDDMKRMVTDLAKNMPLSDLPGGDLLLKGLAELPGIDQVKGDVSTMSYRELRKGLSKAGREALEEKFKPLIKDFRKNHQAAFYSMAALGAVGIGALGYSQGSDALRKLGIKPRLRKKFFDNRLQASIQADWGKKLKDPSGKMSLEAKSADQRLGLIASANVDSQGLQRAEIRGRARIDNKPLGLDSMSLHGSYAHDFSTEQDLTSLGFSGKKGAMSFTASDYRNWSTGDSKTSVDLGAAVWGGRLSGYAAHNKTNGHKENQVGFVYRVAF